jgi:AcrR family transcriptional regulator
MDEAALTGLRERKKQLTRQQISAVATGLFLERGFDRVTVAEVARAANVSTKTVFNYFPRKEDLFFDRGPEAAALVARALRTRPAGEGPLRAFGRLIRRQAASGHPVARIAARDVPFWRTAVESPTLRARLRELVQEAEAGLAALIASEQGLDEDALWPRVQAAAAVGAFRAVYGHALARMLAGADPELVAADYLRDLDRAFDALEAGFAAPEGAHAE